MKKMDDDEYDAASNALADLFFAGRIDPETYLSCVAENARNRMGFSSFDSAFEMPLRRCRKPVEAF